VSAESDRVILLGKITGAHGVKGWVKVHSYTEPPANLLAYPRWLLERGDDWHAVAVETVRESGNRLIAKLVGVEDRDAALELAGTRIGIKRSAMPALASNEYYWADLEGLAVRNLAGELLGTVERLIATGANDVLVLDERGERMIPFVAGETVRQVDLEAGEILVDWDPSYWE
jgi:16S rRNA processing protein RimM